MVLSILVFRTSGYQAFRIRCAAVCVCGNGEGRLRTYWIMGESSWQVTQRHQEAIKKIHAALKQILDACASGEQLRVSMVPERLRLRFRLQCDRNCALKVLIAMRLRLSFAFMTDCERDCGCDCFRSLACCSACVCVCCFLWNWERGCVCDCILRLKALRLRLRSRSRSRSRLRHQGDEVPADLEQMMTNAGDVITKFKTDKRAAMKLVGVYSNPKGGGRGAGGRGTGGGRGKREH